MTVGRDRRCLIHLLLKALVFHLLHGSASSNTLDFNSKVSYRQNVCDRHDAYNNGSVPLRDALRGLELRPIIAKGSSDEFNYDVESGIDSDYPGIVAQLLDEMAQRAGFTWRDSYETMMEFPENSENATFSHVLKWAVQSYDIALGPFAQTSDRLDLGITFLTPWRDATVILIDKQGVGSSHSQDIAIFNWVRPYDATVWFLIVATIILSAFVYQLIEYMQGEREDRLGWQWFLDNLYLSAINFSQNFEYSPTSFGGRVFAVSMTLWALLITATYTANLASLYVEERSQAQTIESIEHAILLKKTICTWARSAHDELIQNDYPDATRIPFATELEGFQALEQGKCDLLAVGRDQWLKYKGDHRYNPDCNLESVGKPVRTLGGAFAVKADSGHKCTTLIRDVLNVHMVEMIKEGYMALFKARQRFYFEAANPTTCNNKENDDARRLSQGTIVPQSRSDMTKTDKRKLKLGGALLGGTASANEASGSSTALTIEQMLGTFVLHWALMTLALLITAFTAFSKRFQRNGKVNRGRSVAAASEEVHNSGKCGACGCCLSNGGIDWEAKYAQMTSPEKAMVELLFKLDSSCDLPMAEDATCHRRVSASDISAHQTQSQSIECTIATKS